MLADPWFYLVSVPAVLLFGIVKGGFGGAIAIISVPLMALVMPPTQAAAILLPILVLMDVLVVKAYWGVFDRRALYLLLPGAVVGVGIGYLSAEAMNEHYMRILIGVLSLVFGLQSLLGLQDLFWQRAPWSKWQPVRCPCGFYQFQYTRRWSALYHVPDAETVIPCAICRHSGHIFRGGQRSEAAAILRPGSVYC